MMEDLISIITAVLIGFVLFSLGLSLISSNAVIGLGFLVAGGIAVYFGFKAFS
jgi:hypothetical protein